MAEKLPFIIESSADGKTWERVGDEEFARAKDAYPHAVHAWESSKILLRQFSYGAEYRCDRVRVRRADSTRAAHSFPNIRTEYVTVREHTR